PAYQPASPGSPAADSQAGSTTASVPPHHEPHERNAFPPEAVRSPERKAQPGSAPTGPPRRPPPPHVAAHPQPLSRLHPPAPSLEQPHRRQHAAAPDRQRRQE